MAKRPVDKTISPAGTRITAHKVKTKAIDKLLTAANTVDLHEGEPGEQIAVALILTRVGEDFDYETVGDTRNYQIIGTTKVHKYIASGVAFVPVDEVHDVVAVMALKILEDEEQRKNNGQGKLDLDGGDEPE
jgi:hypothetical protein